MTEKKKEAAAAKTKNDNAEQLASELGKPMNQRFKWEAVDDQVILKFELIQKMGRGNYGTVYKAIDKRDRSRVAIKKINNAFANMIDA